MSLPELRLGQRIGRKSRAHLQRLSSCLLGLLGRCASFTASHALLLCCVLLLLQVGLLLRESSCLLQIRMPRLRYVQLFGYWGR